MRIFVVLLVLALGCGKAADKPPDKQPEQPSASDAAPSARTSDAAAPAAHPDLKVTVNGKPAAIQSAIAVDEKESVAIKIASYPHSCQDELDVDRRSSTPSDVSFKLRLAPRLSKDGTLGWGRRGTYFESNSSEKQSGSEPVEGSVDAKAGAKFKLGLDFEQKTLGEPPKTLVVKGTIAVTGCGEDKRSKPSDAPVPQPDAFITIAGQKLPIAGAGFVATKTGERRLVVATHPVTCVENSDSLPTRSNVSVELAWGKDGKLFRESLDGYWIDWGANQGAGAKTGLTATPNRAAGTSLKTKLGGSTTINGFAVSLAGTVTAVVCPTPK